MAVTELIPITSETPTQAEENLGFNLKGDAEFVAGLVYGMVGDNHLTEIE